MIDVHCHILPGIDDGAQNLADSISMAKMAVNDGINTIIATPHHMNGRYENKKQSITEKVDELQRKLDEEKIPLKILPGQEVRIHGELLEGLEAGEIQPVADSAYLLIEFPSAHVPRYTEQLFFDLQMKGYTPVIVHPERNQEIIEHPELLYQFIKNGALSQITAGSICGGFGKKIRTFTFQLIEANLTHFIASDAHNITTRAFKMAEAIDIVKERYGNDMVYLFLDNAALLTDGKNVFKDVPEAIKKKRFFHLF